MDTAHDFQEQPINCERVEKEYQDLNQMLPKKLTAAGINYLYADYLKEWSSGKGVPLPFP